MKDEPLSLTALFSYDAIVAKPLDYTLHYSILGPTISYQDSEVSALISETMFDLYRTLMLEARKQ
jgi:hypothetical protein